MVAFAHAILALASAVGFVAAQNRINITAPGGNDQWWVANSINVIAWDCKNTQIKNFTILMANSNPAILPSNIAIVAIQNNYDCSLLMPATLANYTPATGYTIIFGNTLNNTDHYGVSQPFEIKAAGSAYPTTTSIIASNTGPANAASTNKSKSSASRFASPRALAGLLAGGLSFLAI